MDQVWLQQLENGLSTINKKIQRFELSNMPILDNTRTLMIVALFNQAFETSSSGHDKLKGILNVMHVRIDATDSDEDWIFGYDASRFCEWAKISITKHVAGDNLTLLTKV